MAVVGDLSVGQAVGSPAGMDLVQGTPTAEGVSYARLWCIVLQSSIAKSVAEFGQVHRAK